MCYTLTEVLRRPLWLLCGERTAGSRAGAEATATVHTAVRVRVVAVVLVEVAPFWMFRDGANGVADRLNRGGRQKRQGCSHRF